MSEDEELRTQFRALRERVESDVRPAGFDAVRARVHRRRQVRRAVPIVTAAACGSAVVATIWLGTGFAGRDPSAPLTLTTTAPASRAGIATPTDRPTQAATTATTTPTPNPSGSRHRPSGRATVTTTGTADGAGTGTGTGLGQGPGTGTDTANPGSPSTQPPVSPAPPHVPTTVAVPLVNPDFEARPALDGLSVGGSPPGWSGGTGVNNPTWLTYSALGLSGRTTGTMAGPDVLYLSGLSPQPAVQTTTTRIRAGTTYTLTVAVGHRSTLVDIYGGAAIGILADGVVVQNLRNTSAPVNGSFGDVSVTWTATAADDGKALGVGLSEANPGLLNYVDYDNVRLTATS